MKVFLDTNVLVAAFATRGLCEDVLRVILVHHELLVGQSVVEELERVLVEKLRMPRDQASRVADFVRENARVIEPTEPAAWPESDPDDRWVLAAAMEGAADVLVTGDKDLLQIAGVAPLPIVSPRELWERLR